ncbi:MAG: peptidylprolyl isomerase [Proteobacteria bacterium]|nr:peptidylprolyl isomerase [Pseudomonadota bacterium]
MIADGKVVQINYTLTNDAGETLDSSEGRGPLAYLHGSGNIVPGLEAGLAGAKAGDKLTVDVAPDQGYGAHTGEEPQAVRRSEFPKDMELHEGMPIRAEDGQGNTVVLWVVKAEGAWVHVDINHPLAGQTLHFAVEVVDMRDATDVEVQHGHVHGPGGHHH